MVKYAEQYDTHSATTLLSRRIPLYPQNVSPFESLVQYILQSIKPCKMSRYQCVCGIIIFYFLFPDACVCCECPKRTSRGYLLPRHPIREQCVPEARERSQICTLYDTHALVSPCVTAAKRPLTESRHLPNMPPLGISTRADTYPHIHNHRDTHRHTQRETGGTQPH